jgi:beta-glucanase (GH16 family)
VNSTQVRTAILLALLAVLVSTSVSWGLDIPLGSASPVAPSSPVLPAPLASSGGVWVPTFHDEFDGPGLDWSKWSNGFGWGDNAAHVAGYCNPMNNIVDNGVLIQRADSFPEGGPPYNAACLNTKNKFAQLYGYWETRMQVPRGQGLWSSFWAKPNNESWPPELDVVEISGSATQTVIMTDHWRDGPALRAENAKFSGPDFAAGYHVFGAEWMPTETTWYVDGVKIATARDGAAQMSAGGPFYMLLDLQVGLVGASQPDASTPWPVFRYVDYVRVWSRPAAASLTL